MLCLASTLIGRSIRATDGAIGSVVDLLLDDRSWAIRWAVVDTGSWLPGRRVLLPPQQLRPASDDPDVFAVPLTRQQVEDSPAEQADLPVSRRYEQALFAHYQWDPYWMNGGAGMGGVVPMMPILPDPDPTDVPDGDPNLRSVAHVSGYRVRASDGEIGHIADLLVDPESWSVRLVEISTRNWLPGRKVVLAPGLIGSIDWLDQSVVFRKTRAEIEASPPYDPAVS